MYSLLEMSKYKEPKKTPEEIDKLIRIASENRYKCSCGYSVVIYPFEKKEKKLCKNCGHWIYVDKKTQFEETLKRYMKEQQ